MATPNLLVSTSMTGKTDVLDVTTSAQKITENTTASNKIYKVSHLMVANIDGESDTTVTIDLYRANTAYMIAKTISVPADSTLVVLTKDNGLYLEEGDKIRVASANTSALQAICSYDIIDDA